MAVSGLFGNERRKRDGRWQTDDNTAAAAAEPFIDAKYGIVVQTRVKDRVSTFKEIHSPSTAMHAARLGFDDDSKTCAGYRCWSTFRGQHLPAPILLAKGGGCRLPNSSTIKHQISQGYMGICTPAGHGVGRTLFFFICFRLLSFSLMNQTRDLLHKTHLNEMRSCAPCKLASTCKPVRRRARLSLEVAIFMPGRLVKPRRHHCHSCHVNCTTYLD